MIAANGVVSDFKLCALGVVPLLKHQVKDVRNMTQHNMAPFLEFESTFFFSTRCYGFFVPILFFIKYQIEKSENYCGYICLQLVQVKISLCSIVSCTLEMCEYTLKKKS